MQRVNRNHPQKPDAEISLAPGFLRRMGAIFYDALLLLAVLFFATALAMPFNGGQAFTSEQYFYPVYLAVVGFLFYAWFWTHGGQTLGMRAWKIRLYSHAGDPVTWLQALLRFGAAIFSLACLGLGFFWSILDKNDLSWHDRLSGTRLVWERGEKRGP